ncbi:MAG TPA: aldose epimerase family protein [Sphingobacteriaceae bacterium]|nr:aldose epimerase family protein [Sphingobacteriaceae bacterium]
MAFNIIEKPFGLLNDVQVIQYTITNSAGMQVSILNYGAAVTELITPDRNNNMGDVVLGFDSLTGFLQKDNPYFGSVIGRYCNRIANAIFELDYNTYTLAANNNENSLHGGNKGFDKVLWEAEKSGDNSIKLNYLSKDGEEGYPGNLNVQLTYTLTFDNELIIDYSATTDKVTPVNLTNHSYFNLSAGNEPNILNHKLIINADKYLEANDTLIPTGKLTDVKGSVMDFTTEKIIGKDILEVEGGGYDHNFVLDNKGDITDMAASVYDPGSGRYMEVFTTEPGLQLYTGNFLDGTLTDTKNGKIYVKHAAFCLEAQHFPNSPNQPSFPNTILNPGETYKQRTIYKFGVK